MNFWLEALGIFGIPIVVSVLFIGGYFYLAHLWQRRALHLRARHTAVTALHLEKGPHN